MDTQQSRVVDSQRDGKKLEDGVKYYTYICLPSDLRLYSDNMKGRHQERYHITASNQSRLPSSKPYQARSVISDGKT